MSVPVTVLLAITSYGYVHSQSNTLTECGKTAPTPLAGRIVGGHAAAKNAYPWQISFRHQQAHKCGGSIISKRWVVTAAHCLRNVTTDKPLSMSNMSQFVVVVGDYNRMLIEADEMTLPVRRLIEHPQYGGGTTHDNDIALVELGADITFSHSASPVCLPAQRPLVGTTCTVTGWGRVEANTRRGSDVLQMVEVPIADQVSCDKAMEKAAKKSITSNMLCAGTGQGRQDACNGDSGGPLVCRAAERWTLYGVVSWGYGCATQNTYGIYVDVTRYLDWIKGYTGLTPPPPSSLSDDDTDD